MNKKGEYRRVLLKKKINNFNVNTRVMFGLSFFSSNMNQLLNDLSCRLRQKEKNIWITTVNTEFIMLMRKNKNFADIIGKSDIRIIDGIGLIWAYNVLKIPKGIRRWWRALKVGIEILRGKNRKYLISGADLMAEICKNDVYNKVYFLGGWGDRAMRVANYFKSRNEKLETGFSGGYPEVDNEKVVREINKFEPDYLFVAYGMKKQEEWINANLNRLRVGVVMGVGRSFDYYSGDLKRAPKWARKVGLEWLYSLIREPKRWKRQLSLPRFIWMVLTEVA